MLQIFVEKWKDVGLRQREVVERLRRLLRRVACVEKESVTVAAMHHGGRIENYVIAARDALRQLLVFFLEEGQVLLVGSEHVRFGIVNLEKEQRLPDGFAVRTFRQSGYGHHASIEIDASLEAGIEHAGEGGKFRSRGVPHSSDAVEVEPAGEGKVFPAPGVHLR